MRSEYQHDMLQLAEYVGPALASDIPMLLDDKRHLRSLHVPSEMPSNEEAAGPRKRRVPSFRSNSLGEQSSGSLKEGPALLGMLQGNGAAGSVKMPVLMGSQPIAVPRMSSTSALDTALFNALLTGVSLPQQHPVAKSRKRGLRSMSLPTMAYSSLPARHTLTDPSASGASMHTLLSDMDNSTSGVMDPPPAYKRQGSGLRAFSCPNTSMLVYINDRCQSTPCVCCMQNAMLLHVHQPRPLQASFPATCHPLP